MATRNDDDAPAGLYTFQPVKEMIGSIRAGAWQRLSCGGGAHGPRVYDWAWTPIRTTFPHNWPGWVLARRSRRCECDLVSRGAVLDVEALPIGVTRHHHNVPVLRRVRNPDRWIGRDVRPSKGRDVLTDLGPRCFESSRQSAAGPATGEAELRNQGRRVAVLATPALVTVLATTRAEAREHQVRPWSCTSQQCSKEAVGPVSPGR
jgi:hypothetical protein